MQKIQSGTYRKILIFVLVLLAAVSLSRYIWGLRTQVKVLENEKRNLLQELKKEKEVRERLIQENLLLKGNLEAAQGEVARFKEEISQSRQIIEQLNAQLLAFKQAPLPVAGEKSVSGDKMSELSRQEDELKLHLDSIAKLKKAIRQLKRQVHKVGKEINGKSETVRFLEGNRGFLLREGKSTIPARLKIEVNPASAKQ